MSAHAGHNHGRRREAPLRTALVLTAGIALLELIGGLFAHSLALVSDAAHVFMDAIALGIAVAASVQARRPATSHRSFGYARVEVLAALGNAVLLFGITVLIVVEAIHRFGSPELPSGGLMVGVALVGIVVNASLGIALARGAHDNLNVKGALFHVASDAVSAVAVAIGGVLVLVTRASWIDPALSLLVAALIVAGVFNIVREAADVLLESAPDHATLPKVRDRIREFDGVVGVHDLHVWTLGAGACALSAHVLLYDAKISEASALLREIDAGLRAEFGITHLTIQFECESCGDDERIICTQVAADDARAKVSAAAKA